jgi:alpha-methylacyl-CoA racemase
MNEVGPLSGLKVLELSGLGPAPFAAMTLADLGADVIRVDRPDAVSPVPLTSRVDVLGRGKRSIELDLKQPAAVSTVLSLVERADVLIEGYRPGVTERLGLGPDECLSRNPRLVYARMTGWGQDGPWAHAAGHDIDYIALTGALHAIGAAGGPPQIPLNLLGDFGGGGMYLALGILAAAREADRTGRGQVVDAAIIDGTAHLMAGTHTLLAAGAWRDERGVNVLDGGAPFYAVYETADGRHMAVGAIEPKFYATLLTALGIGDDPADQHDRSHWPDLQARMAAVFAGRTQAHWVSTFDGTDACVAPVLGIREAASHPQMAARGTLIEVDGVLQPAPAPRFSGHPQHTPAAAPAVPSDASDILREWSSVASTRQNR